MLSANLERMAYDPDHPSYSLEELGAAIRSARRSWREITREQLAQLVGESPDVIRRLEEGKNVSGRVLMKVLDELQFELVIRPRPDRKGWRPEDARADGRPGFRPDWLGLADSFTNRTQTLEQELASYLEVEDYAWLEAARRRIWPNRGWEGWAEYYWSD